METATDVRGKHTLGALHYLCGMGKAVVGRPDLSDNAHNLKS
jgi:hypothetical protein